MLLMRDPADHGTALALGAEGGAQLRKPLPHLEVKPIGRIDDHEPRAVEPDARIARTVNWYLDNETWWRPLVEKDASKRVGLKG